MTKKEIAEAFSNGNFELTYPYLSENVQWTVVGEDYFNGKKAVIDNCRQVARYFNSVTTNFITVNVIADNNRVAVSGTAEFIRDGKTVNFISACDIYEFNCNNELTTITSYCIQKQMANQ
ncbi:MAG: nuclear transport factor 2 family protein [Candidatus Kapabacteria bacterium]|nr:nuclear transport factor 2 family protein [Ignavibacteriota bacterium]MCW5884067.1 nuclear transport factor 2 family protein [Candidatus Kapabacteria bacterium]MCW5919430.1 nuclear transport factor 2 family protein [Bacteroidota bacterium]